MNITGSVITAISAGISTLQQTLSRLPETQTILVSISFIIVIAAIFALIFKVLRQELIPAYIITGLIIGPLILGLVKNTVLITGLAEIGVAFLLFVAGLEISMPKLKETGKSALIAGFFQIVIISVATFFISTALGFPRIESICLALILTFSSTVLVVKVFADKHELNTLHSRIAISILMLQDIIAVLALAMLSNQFTAPFIYAALLKLPLIILVAFFLSLTILRPLFKFSSKSTELLFIVSLAFVFLFSAFAHYLGLSIIIGSFVAGLAIANMPYRLEIESKIRPLRDFFAIIFFVSLGMLLTSFDISALIIPFIVFLALVIVAKPIITTLIVRLTGYKTRTSTLTGFSLAQISEFSLILALQGLVLGILSQATFNLVIMIAIITMALTPYAIKSCSFFSSFLGKIGIEKIQVTREKGYRSKTKKTVLLLGCHRMGTVFLKQLSRFKHKILVIDFNPTIIHALKKQQVSCIYGDVANTELLEQLPLSKIKVAISTIPNKENNMLMIEYLKKKKPDIFVVVTAEKIHDALEFYNVGADYVILPYFESAEKSIELIKKLTKKDFTKVKKQQIAYLYDLHRFLY